MQGQQLNGWHTVFDAATGLWRLARLKDGIVQEWGSQPAPPGKPVAKAEAKSSVQNFGVSMEQLRKEAPLGWTASRGANFKPPLPPDGDDPQIVAGQQVSWPTLEQARGLDLAAYVAPGIVILAALWLLLHNPKGSR